MFTHNLKYTLKTLLLNKMLIFWTLAFPLILGLFFQMAFADIEKNETLDIIDIAIVDDTSFKSNTLYQEVFKELSSKDNKERLFNTRYVDLEKAEDLLAEDKITGYLHFKDETPKIVILRNGVNETILKEVVEKIEEQKMMGENIVEQRIKNELVTGNDIQPFVASVYQDVVQKVDTYQKNMNIVDTSSSHLSYTMIEFYTLIAMACLYGGILGLYAINNCLANMSNKGKRLAVSPVSKAKLILSSVLASYFVQLIGLILLFLFTIFILKVDYGSNYPLVFLLSLVGSLAGLSMGVFIACVVKTNENTKTGLIIALTMFGSFLSGMMGITMKYVVDKNIPLLNQLNPANMITDGLYSLYYYPGLERYYFNLISLVIFSVILIILSIFSLRRQKYDSI